MNTGSFLAEPSRYFSGSFEAFCSFGGPCVYFHDECLRAGQEDFLSKRHLEMLYATLTAWGMHRMGDPVIAKTKLTAWSDFSESILGESDALRQCRGHRMLGVSESEYGEAILRLKPVYGRLRLSVANATVVVNSKALFHLFPEFIPPIDRQYTVRFFKKAPEQWFDRKGSFRAVSLPPGRDAQFELFRDICMKMKRLADRLEPEIFDAERRAHGVGAPKALDNAIVNYVTLVSEQRPNYAQETVAPDDTAGTIQLFAMATDDRSSVPRQRLIGKPPVRSEVRAMTEVSFQGYVIRKLETGGIEVLRDGVRQSPVKPALRKLASSLNVGLPNGRGDHFTTRQLGSKIIKSIQHLGAR